MLTFDKQLQVERALAAYAAAWQGLAGKPDGVVPTTLSIKVADKAALYQMLEANASNIEQVHIGTVNGRYIASAVLFEPYEGLYILKVLERRNGSGDPLGLDSLDYYCDDMERVYQAFSAAGNKIVKEANNVHAWLSLRFGETDQFEAKFTDHLVTEVGSKELAIAKNHIFTQLGLQNRLQK